MIKALLILLLSSACILTVSANFGLQTTKGELLELIELKTKALVEGPYAQVQYIQTYKNLLPHTVETEFHFPRTENSIFHKFEAVFQNKTIVGRVLDKETAKTMYDWNTKRGNTVAYSERSQNAPDIMSVKVGNIPANETVEIIFSVIQPLEIIINKFYELKLPMVLAEGYFLASVDFDSDSHIQFVDTQDSLYKLWSIEVEVNSNSPFAILNNPTHMLKPKLSERPSGFRSKIYKAVWNATITSNKDFIIYFGPEKLEKPETILATYPQEPNNHVLLVNFIPDLTTIQPKTAQDLLYTNSNDGLLKLKRMVYEYDIEHAQAEFIFVIDRSGSMEGARITNLRRALAKFLTTIPRTSYFNIVSFGSNYRLYRPQSILNSPQALEEALEWAKTIEADMGGTEILEALKYLSSSKHQDINFPRIVMILTDGDVFNVGQVISYIADNAVKTRFCSVGIGRGASTYLVRNMGKAGKCGSEFVLDNEDIGDKALYMVKAAISQYVTDIRFDINCLNDQNQRVYSDKIELDLLLKDQTFKRWIYLENIPNLKSCQATLAYYNSLKGKRVTEEMDIQAYEIEEFTNFWHKIAYDAKIKELEEGIKIGRTSYKGEDAQSHIVGLSTKYQVLSDYTSFLAVLQESTVDPSETAQKIHIPSIVSDDYSASRIEFQRPSGHNEGFNYAENHRQAVNSLPRDYGERRYGKSTDPGDIYLDVTGVTDVSIDVELEYFGYGDCPELDIGINVEAGLDVDVDDYHSNGDEEEGENENKGGDQHDIIDESRQTNSKTADPDTIQAGWSCEGADDTSTKECSQRENSEKQEELQEKEEASAHKVAESSDLKFVNMTNSAIHANITELASKGNENSQHLIENSVPSASALTQISDKKGPESLQESEEKSSKILANLGLTGIGLIIILLSIILL